MKLQGWISAAVLVFIANASLGDSAEMGRVESISYLPAATGGSFQITYHGAANFKVYQIEDQKRLVLVAEHLELPAQLTKIIDSSSKDGPVIQITPYNSGGTGGVSSKFVMQLRKGVEFLPLEVPGKFTLKLTTSNLNDRKLELGTKAKRFVRKSYLPNSWVEGEEEAAESSIVKRKKDFDSISSTSSAVEKENEAAKKLIAILNSEDQNKEYFGKPVDFIANDASIHAIFQLVGQASGLNIITDSEVQSKSSYSLTGIAWDHLLDLALQQAQLKASAVGNVIRITTLKKYNEEQEEKKKLIALGKQLEPVVMAVVPLSFAKADILKTMITSLLIIDTTGGTTSVTEKKGDVTTETKKKDDSLSEAFKRGALEVDSRSNSLIITNTKQAVERIRKLIKQLDVPQPQVLVDAKIILANEDFSRELGIKFNAGSNRPGTDAVKVGDDFVQGNFSSPLGLGANGSAVSQAAFPLTFAIGTRGQSALNLALNLAEKTSMSKTIASPRIITQNNESATITDGKKILVPVAVGSAGTPGFSTLDINVSLAVTPQVTSSGYVLLKSSVSHAIPEGSAGGSSNKSISSNVMIESGGTLVLGGVYQYITTRTINGIPILKDLPFIGPLFQDTNSKSSGKSEMMVFLSPQIMEAAKFQESAPEKNQQTGRE